MEISELQARAAAIPAEMSADGVTEETRKALLDELNGIKTEIDQRKQAAEAAAEIRAAVANGEGETIRSLNDMEGNKMEKTYNAASPEYRSAFLKTLKGEELTEEERSAYTGTTGDTTANNHGMGLLVPTTMLNRIWDLIEEQHAIMGDITLYRTNTYLTIPVHTAIAQGDATTVAENAANDDEINNWNTVTLHGVDYSKTVKISYAMATMSIDALETYLTNEIAARLGAAMARDTIAGILANYYTTDATFVALSDTLSFNQVAQAFGALHNANGQAVVYANNRTIFNRFVGMVDSNGRPIFQANAQIGAAGTLIGAPVKTEDGLSDDVILVGYPQNVVGNVVQDVMVESNRDIEKHVIVYSGYARYESKLIAPKSFAKITVTTATTAG